MSSQSLPFPSPTHPLPSAPRSAHASQLHSLEPQRLSYTEGPNPAHSTEARPHAAEPKHLRAAHSLKGSKARCPPRGCRPHLSITEARS